MLWGFRMAHVQLDRTLVPGIAHRLGDEEEVWNAIVVGLREYVAKNGFQSVLRRAISGIDSALVCSARCMMRST
jgi:NAD+ synthase (glutamine-hydrolysing)